MADDDEEQGSIQEDAPQPGDESDQAITPVEVKALAPPKYEVRPGLGEKFKGEAVRDVIVSTMQEQLMGRPYRADQAPRWAKTIANAVRQRVQELDMKRYKIIAQSTILEMKGAGIKSGQRCVWDPETDDFVYDMYRSDTLMCHTIVYGIYMY